MRIGGRGIQTWSEALHRRVLWPKRGRGPGHLPSQRQMNSICTRLLATLRRLEKHRCKGNGYKAEAFIHLESIASAPANIDAYIDPDTCELRIISRNLRRQPHSRSCVCLHLFVPATNDTTCGYSGEKTGTGSMIDRTHILANVDTIQRVSRSK